MENQIQIFKNESFGEIRTCGTPDNPLFCLSDVCNALDLTAKFVKQRLEDKVVSNNPILDTLGRPHNVLFVNEDGLYDVILDSRKPSAKMFRKWVTSEVLPSIRKHGAYLTNEAVERAITEPDFLIELATTIKKERQQRLVAEQQIAEQNKLLAEKDNKIDALHGQVANMQKQVSYLDLILGTTDSVTITQIAQDYGLSAIGLNKLLFEKRVQHKVGGQWILYGKYIQQCYVRSEVVTYNDKEGRQHAKQNTKWTQKGRLFLYDLLKKEGYVPLIEKQQPSLFANVN